MTITATHDVSASFGPARHQGPRSTCLAFAVSDLNRLASCAPGDLSPDFLYRMAGSLTPGWKPGEGLYVAQALRAAHAPGQPLESDWPYVHTEPADASAPIAPTALSLYGAALHAGSILAATVVDAIREGRAVGLVIQLTPGFYAPIDGVVSFSPYALPNRYHAIVATGVGTSSSGDIHLLVRNSWGAAWGVQGHAWLPATYVDTHALEAFGG